MPRRRLPAGLRSDEAAGSMVVLMEELVEEILLRFPPAEPASLVRAALVCKPWCRLISGRRFHRRFREFHRSPPMLGYLCNLLNDMGPVSRFIPACPRLPDQVNWEAIDTRHGRVLLRSVRGRPRISVWDPITGERWELPPLSDAWYEDDEYYWNAAVLCAATGGGCDHLDCRGKPFLVVCAGYCGTEMISLCIYSSETGSWSEPIFAAPRAKYGVTDQAPPALVGNTLYFMVRMASSILRYDLVTREASMVENVAEKSLNYPSVSTALEDGGMALGVENYSKLFLWSMETSPKGDISWKKIRMIELNELLPVTVRDRPVDVNCLAFVPRFGILVYTSPRLFSIDLKSDKVEVLCEGRHMSRIVPYRSFYIPALGSFAAVEGAGADA